MLLESFRVVRARIHSAFRTEREKSGEKTSSCLLLTQKEASVSIAASLPSPSACLYLFLLLSLCPSVCLAGLPLLCCLWLHRCPTLLSISVSDTAAYLYARMPPFVIGTTA